MLAQRLRRWPNIKTPLFQRVVFVGLSVITFRGRKGLYQAAVSLQIDSLCNFAPLTVFNPYATLTCSIIYIIVDSISSF